MGLFSILKFEKNFKKLNKFKKFWCNLCFLYFQDLKFSIFIRILFFNVLILLFFYTHKRFYKVGWRPFLLRVQRTAPTCIQGAKTTQNSWRMHGEELANSFPNGWSKSKVWNKWMQVSTLYFVLQYKSKYKYLNINYEYITIKNKIHFELRKKFLRMSKSVNLHRDRDIHKARKMKCSGIQSSLPCEKVLF